MWETFKEIWPQSFLKIAFFLIVYGLYCGIRIIFKDEKKKRDDKRKNERRKKMKRYICVNCGQVFTGWAVGKICQKCGGKLELIVEKE